MALPFKVKWRIAENDLIALKDSSANGCLLSNYVTTSAGIQYRLQIYPNGNRESNRGNVFIFLVVKIGSLKEVKAKCTIKVEFANSLIREIEHTFKESGGWGKCLCDAAELFDVQKGFIHDGKMGLKVDGIFEFEKDESISCKIVSTLGNELWSNEESKDFKILVDGKVIKAHKVILASASPVFNEMITSKSKDAIENQLTISEFSFPIVEWALIEIYSCSSFSMKNVNVNSLIQFFDKFRILFLKNKYDNILLQLTGKSVPNSDEISKIENNGSIVTLNCSNIVGENLWKNEESKDYTIVVDGKILKVHKLILATRSPAFASMFRTEPTKNQIEISSFSFDVVEVAMKAVYQFNCISTDIVNDTLLIFQFLLKYDFLSAKDMAEKITMYLINAVNVCHLTNCAIITNSTKLQKKCMKFLMSAFATNKPLYDAGNLDKNVALKIVQRSGYRIDDKDAALKLLEESLCDIVYTRKENASSFMMPASK